MMDREANIDLIRALEKQIEEGKGDIIKLKRARNSLLNISTRVPPEILGQVFAWCLARGVDDSPHSPSHFTGFRIDSYNFLLVCHHWFEVASRTPEVWSFWGNTLQDWKKRHHRPGAAPLDLVLNGPECDLGAFFDGSLQCEVMNRVMQDTIRQVHLRSDHHNTLTSIISSLTPGDEGGQNDNIESIFWITDGFLTVDVSNFFTRSRLSRLRSLDLYGNFRISSWDRLASRTKLLTTLCIDIGGVLPSPSPTASQLFSILASNPNLRELRLSDAALPNDADGSAFKVPLPDLKTLTLKGEFRRLFGFLHRLTLPQTLDEIYLTGSNPTVGDISRTLTPYMQDYFRRNTRLQGTLEVYTFSSHGSISIQVGVAGGWVGAAPWVSLTVDLDPIPPLGVLGQFLVNLVAPIPQESVVSFTAELDMKIPDELLFAMPNINTLNICGVKLTKGFLRSNPDVPQPDPKTKLLPSLRSLLLGDITLDDGNWDHLTTYLAHQTSDDQIISLRVFGDVPHIPPEVANEIEDLVEEFVYPQNPG